jgi:hypothetical protein
MKIYILQDSDGDPLIPEAVYFNKEEAIRKCEEMARSWGSEITRKREEAYDYTSECRNPPIVSAWCYDGEEFVLTVTEVETEDEL